MSEDQELSDSSAFFDDDESLESATDYDQRRHSRRRYRTPTTAHASTAATRTTPSTGGSTAPSSATPDSQPSPPQSVPSDDVFRTPEQLRPSVPTRPSKSSHKRGGAGGGGGGMLKPLDEEREVNQLSVSECVTPLMVNLAAQKASPDSSKTVRFRPRDSEYPTPLVARNISFSHESMDSSSEADSTVRASGYARRSFAAPPNAVAARRATAVTGARATTDTAAAAAALGRRAAELYGRHERRE
ncbi:hypothetical protein PINS_up010942 [Pythium insidiosum]|nr:hypothetical protein PINS_up010942 [Pythium insidiosum]